MKKLLVIALSAFVIISCTPTEKAVQRVEGKHFGATISDKGAISYDALLTKLEKSESLDAVKVRGEVSGVCKKKGCWITLVSKDPAKEEMFVKFKDYGFFMPKDIEGKTVVMEGKAFKETTSVDELRHYAEDNGESQDAIAKITEPKVELKFLASGVILED